MSENFQAYSQYYDLLYKDKDYVGEVEYIHHLIKKYNPGSKKILEFGSGTGHHGKLLSKKGYNVVGIERSSDMVKLANLKVNDKNFTSIVGDIAETQLDEKFDAVVALFHVISYQTTNDQLIGVFNNAHKHLCNGGIFLFDVWYTPAVYNHKPDTRVKKIENERIKVIRIAKPVIHSNENVVEVKYHLLVQDRKTRIVEEFHEVHPMRYFSIPEISLLAKLTGFILLKAEEFFSSNPPTHDTWGVCFVLKKA